MIRADVGRPMADAPATNGVNEMFTRVHPD